MATAPANPQIVAMFQQMAAVLEILDDDVFRINAFHRAARVIEDLGQDLSEIGPEAKRLVAIEGIGKGTAQRICEFLTTGQMTEHVDLLAKIPPGLLELLAIAGLGPKTVRQLWTQAGVESLNDLNVKLQNDQLAQLPGLGAKKLENLRKSIAFAQRSSDRVRLGQAMPLALWYIAQLRRVKGVGQVAFAGSLRRGMETIGDIDLIVATDRAATRGQRPGYEALAKAIGDAFVNLQPVRHVLARGPTKTSVRSVDRIDKPGGEIQVDLRVVRPESYGAALMYFTGSKEHNVALRERAIKQGAKLNEYGLYNGDRLVAGHTERQVYEALGLDWIPPELREARGELALAQDKRLGKLIELADVKAELHAHTLASDGRWSIQALATAAAKRGFHSVAVTDHSPTQVLARGLSIKRLEKHIQAIGDLADQLKGTVTLLAGSEVDILADGSLDYPDQVLAQLDVVVASPHSGLTQSPAKATKRLLKAINHPSVTIIGHPTGRLIGRREGLTLDMNQIVTAAAQRGIALEINANSWRLDLNDRHARLALDAGVKLAINTDAHGPGDLDQLIYGVLTARRAGATPAQVINCMSRQSLAKWLKSTRP